MLPPKHRLAKTTEIAAVQTRGRRFFSQFFVAVIMLQTQTQAKAAFVVSTKVSKKAVDRNRIKRAMRDAVQAQIASWRPGNYVFIAKPAAGKQDKEVLNQEFQKLLKSLPQTK